MKEQLRTAQSRIKELEGVESQQSDRIRQLETDIEKRKAAPTTPVQRAVEVITKGLTRSEERWLTDLGNAIQGGYDPLRDPLVDCKFEEICAEQDLADAEESVGRAPIVRLHRRGMVLFPLAVWAARMARQDASSQRASGAQSRISLPFGQRLSVGEEEFLCKLSEASKRDLVRSLESVSRRKN